MAFREGNGILSIFEAEGYVNSLEPLDVKEVGSDKWMQQHDYLEKLNIQAHHNALSKHDEFVVDCINTNDKLKVLVHELLVVELWRDQLFPLVAPHLNEFHQVKVYMILYHEATLCNLLEVLLYHEATLESGEDALAELVDYCYRKITMLNTGHFQSLQEPIDARALGKETPYDTLCRQKLEIGFASAVSALSMIRFVTDHINSVPVSILARLLDSQDLCLAMVPLVENPPWTRQTGAGKCEKFIDQKWVEVTPDNRVRLTKTEGQVWLCLYNLLMDNECRKHYKWNTHRKDVVLRLRRYFNDVLIDQLPMLIDLRRLVEELGVVDPPAPSSNSLAIVEQMPEIRNNIVDKIAKNDQGKYDWDSLVVHMLAHIFLDDEESRQKDIKRLAATYNLDNFEEVLEDPKCALCGMDAVKRCSRCQTEWYCSRECQVAAWKKYHKEVCNLLVEAKKTAPLS